MNTNLIRTLLRALAYVTVISIVVVIAVVVSIIGNALAGDAGKYLGPLVLFTLTGAGVWGFHAATSRGTRRAPQCHEQTVTPRMKRP